MISPIWIDPLFNTFGPMKNKTLEARILLADRAGIQGSVCSKSPRARIRKR
jgi:hypothetical protein